MLSIPPPLIGLESSLAAVVAAGGVVLGVIVLLWGRKVHRVLAGLGAAGAGVLLGAPVAQRLTGLDMRFAQAIAGATAGIVGIVLARIIWAALAGAFFGSAAGAAAVIYCLSSMPEELTAAPPAAGAGAAEWWTATLDFTRSAVQTVWAKQTAILLGAMVPGGLAPLVTGLFRPRLGAIFMTALVGSLSMVGGALVAAERFQPSIWASAWANPHVPGAVAGGLLLIGMAFQYRSALAADRAKKGEKPAARKPEQAEKKPSSSE